MSKRHLNPIQRTVAVACGKTVMTINGQSFDIGNLADEDVTPLVEEIMDVCQLTAQELVTLSQELLNEIRKAKV